MPNKETGMTLQDIIADIHALTEDIEVYERKYGVLSETLNIFTNDPTLESTHPHHKHIPPNIKHNRIPAPNMSFAHPNLPALAREIEDLIAQSAETPEK